MKQKGTLNFWALGLLIAAALFLIFTAHRDFLANLAWQKYRRPNLALFMGRNDVNLAMLIGNFYFSSVIGGKEYNPDIAKKAYEKAVAINKKILWGHYQLARIYFIKGDFDKALKEINNELEYNPENLRSLYVRGLILGYRGRAGDLEKAEADFRRFIQWAPKEWAGYNDLVWILSKEEKYEEAEEVISEAFKNISGAKENSWLWNSLGVAELNLKKYSAAVNSFSKAKELSARLTPDEWLHSYPGNNPATAGEGLSAFFSAINENLRRAKTGLVDNSF